MRLDVINETRAAVSGIVQPLPDGDFSDEVGIDFTLRAAESRKRTMVRALSRPVLTAQQKKIRETLNEPLNFHADLLTIGDRFGDDASWSYLLSNLPCPMGDLRVLIPGCYMGNEDVQFWLRRGVKSLHGVDIYTLTKSWNEIVPKLEATFGIPVVFAQGSIEDIPFTNDSFDMIATNAVLEHVRNLDQLVAETARVLAPGGMCLHAFGPLYHAFGGDHCIAAFGEEAGYDHILLDDAEYKERLKDEKQFVEASGNPNLPFWALRDQFSFAKPVDYIRAFQKHFDIVHVLAKLSEHGVRFRTTYPEKWLRLLNAGLSETDLLVKSLNLVARKKADAWHVQR